jgi:uncharacterized membrane protein
LYDCAPILDITHGEDERLSSADASSCDAAGVMSKTRLEAFFDAVIAIIITIMVLEMKVPHGDNIETLFPLIPVFLSYVLSFLYLGIYWNNRHHMLHACQRTTGSMLWANLHLLFGCR